MSFKRNEGLHTKEAEIINNIVTAMESWGCNQYTKTATKSAIGYAAYPNYSFRWPQGAAFSVAKIVSKLRDLEIIGYGIKASGYYLKPKYKQKLEALAKVKGS